MANIRLRRFENGLDCFMRRIGRSDSDIESRNDGVSMNGGCHYARGACRYARCACRYAGQRCPASGTVRVGVDSFDERGAWPCRGSGSCGRVRGRV